MKRVIAVLLVGSALGLAACGGGERSPARPRPRRRRRRRPPAPRSRSRASRSPQTIKAKVGEKITWTNDDAAPHTVTAKSGGELDSGTIAQGASFSFTPSKAGTIAYFCEIHPSMVGTIDVS